MFSLKSLLSIASHRSGNPRRTTRRSGTSVACGAESVEPRIVLTTSPLPVLMVISDQRDFYYQEYGDTRDSLEAAGVSVVVAATSTDPSTPHAGTGQGASSGIVEPDLALANVNPDDYSAILFVGGWGSSMYQYAFEGDYADDLYDGDLATKQLVNNLINEFVDQDKFVTAICHGVTVLAWARVDGVSPLNGLQVSAPFIGSPAFTVDGVPYANFAYSQQAQIVANGGLANVVSGQYGIPGTAVDDAVVSGKIITAENYDSAAWFGTVVAQEVLAAAQPPANQSPVAVDSLFVLPENSAIGTVIGQVQASDPDAGQSLTFEIISGNDSGAFAVDPVSGVISVASSGALNFEVTPQFELTVSVTDNGTPALGDLAIVTVQLEDVVEPALPGVFRFANQLVVQGTTGNDTVYLWSGSNAEYVQVWMNGINYGGWMMTPGESVTVRGSEGNDQIYATDLRRSVAIFGEGGHDLIVGGSANDLLDGGAGVDRIHGMGGADLILGGDGDDVLNGQDGDDIIVGGDGNDWIDGSDGRDLLLGGLGRDNIRGGTGDDILIGGQTTFDQDTTALLELRQTWTSEGSVSQRAALLREGTSSGVRLRLGESVFDDGFSDVLVGKSGADLVFAQALDEIYSDLDDLFATV
jgi:putative intracellular protease/amidase